MKKKPLLPKVSPVTKDVLLRDLMKHPKLVQEELDKIDLENPEVKWLIDNYSKQSVEPHEVRVMGVLVYKLIEGQLEADELDRLFDDDKKK